RVLWPPLKNHLRDTTRRRIRTWSGSVLPAARSMLRNRKGDWCHRHWWWRCALARVFQDASSNLLLFRQCALIASRAAGEAIPRLRWHRDRRDLPDVLQHQSLARGRTWSSPAEPERTSDVLEAAFHRKL